MFTVFLIGIRWVRILYWFYLFLYLYGYLLVKFGWNSFAYWNSFKSIVSHGGCDLVVFIGLQVWDESFLNRWVLGWVFEFRI